MSFQAIKLSLPVINIRGDSFLIVAWKERFFLSKFFATQRTWPRLKILANILVSLFNDTHGFVLDNTTILFFSFENRGSSIMCMRFLFTRDSAKGGAGGVFITSANHMSEWDNLQTNVNAETHVLRLPWNIVHGDYATLEANKYYYVINDSKLFLARFLSRSNDRNWKRSVLEFEN